MRQNSGMPAVQHAGHSAVVRRRHDGAAEADRERLAAAVAAVHVRNADDQGSHVLQLSPYDHRAALRQVRPSSSLYIL